ncbi:hypothetical protein WCLP8_1240002 [uncultured Gammaproteobacteria bacterium]
MTVRERVAGGVAAAERAVKQIGNVSNSVVDLAAKVKNLNVATEQITTIVKTIEKIASQTNLLALNATIDRVSGKISGTLLPGLERFDRIVEHMAHALDRFHDPFVFDRDLAPLTDYSRFKMLCEHELEEERAPRHAISLPATLFGMLPIQATMTTTVLGRKTPFDNVLGYLEAEPEKFPLGWFTNRALFWIDFQLQFAGQEFFDAFHHPLTSPQGADIDVAIICVADEVQFPAFQFFVQYVEH